MNIELQVIGSALRAVCEEMGAVLVRSAFSANIKERRDCSTALFGPDGRMVAQAEHIPVHLGAMPDAVAAVAAREPGHDEVYVLNDPFAGGTHLPDITLVSRTALGYAVTRAHHADVGGSEPGSMPAGSRTLAEEGVVIPPTPLDPQTLDTLVARMRNPDERRGDLRAQLASQALARRRVDELCARYGADRVHAAMDELYAYSERVVRAGVVRIPDGVHEAEDVVEAQEGELTIRARVTVAGDRIDVDFAGTDQQHDGNLNCPLSVTRSACYFVVRCLTAPDVPASGGAFAPVTVRAPEGSLVNARAPAAVAAGNVETSSRIVDVVFAAFAHALPVPAAGQGTMNNVTLGNDRFTYYETIGGGQGACPGRGRAVRDPRGDVEHALDTRRGPRARLPAPRRAPRAPPRLGRRRALPRRRRGRPRAARARGVPPLSPERAPGSCAHGRRRRRARPSGPQPRQRPGGPRQGDARPRSRRRRPHRDAWRRRLRSAYAGVSRSSRGTRCSSRVAPTPATRHAVAARSQSAFGERWSTKPPTAGPTAKPISHESVENAM